jgi:uncharacterized protein YjbI with pentapeptide repeats
MVTSILPKLRKHLREWLRRASSIPSSVESGSGQLKAWWAARHTLHVLLAVIGAIAGSITLLITAHGFLTYVSEAPDRAEQNRLLRLQTVNAAWDTIRSVKGSRTERGQSFALRALVESKIDLSGLDLSHTSIERTPLTGAQLSNSNLTGAFITKVSFDGGAMGGASMGEGTLEGVTMDRMEGLPATLEGAFVLDTIMSSKLETGLVAVSRMDLRDALVVHTTLELVNDKHDFRGACLLGVSYTVRRKTDDPGEYWGAVFRSANFSSSIIAGGTFWHADLDGADFRNARFVVPASFTEKFREIQQATHYRLDTEAEVQVAQLRRDGRLPLCLQHQAELLMVLNRLDNYVGEAITPPDVCCYAQSDADRWLGGGRMHTEFGGASLKGTRFEGADLRGTHGISQSELDQACVDDRTLPPAGLRRPSRRCVEVVQDDQGSVRTIVYDNGYVESQIGITVITDSAAPPLRSNADLGRRP